MRIEVTVKYTEMEAAGRIAGLGSASRVVGPAGPPETVQVSIRPARQDPWKATDAALGRAKLPKFLNGDGRRYLERAIVRIDCLECGDTVYDRDRLPGRPPFNTQPGTHGVRAGHV